MTELIFRDPRLLLAKRVAIFPGTEQHPPKRAHYSIRDSYILLIDRSYVNRVVRRAKPEIVQATFLVFSLVKSSPHAGFQSHAFPRERAKCALFGNN